MISKKGKKKNQGSYLLSHSRTRAVSSALKSLTSGFGMGPGVASSVLPPRFESKITLV